MRIKEDEHGNPIYERTVTDMIHFQAVEKKAKELYNNYIAQQKRMYSMPFATWEQLPDHIKVDWMNKVK
jgi:hypothetical protein